MLNFYLIILALSGTYLIVQVAAFLFYGKIFFRDAGVLFQQRKNRFEWQMVFPKNLLLLIICVFSTALFGLIMTALNVVGWLSLPLGAVGGLAMNFIVNAAVVPMMDKRDDSGSPTDEQLEGMDAVVLSEITEEDYGRIEVTHGRRRYDFDAMTANGRTLTAGTQVVVIHAQDGLCFVEDAARLYDVLFDEQDTTTEDDLRGE